MKPIGIKKLYNICSPFFVDWETKASTGLALIGTTF